MRNVIPGLHSEADVSLVRNPLHHEAGRLTASQQPIATDLALQGAPAQQYVSLFKSYVPNAILNLA